MNESAEEILRKALALDTEERACLAELDDRTVKTVPWSEVKERLFHGF